MFGESYFSIFIFILALSIVPSPWTNNEIWPFWLPTPCLPLLCFFWVSFQYFCISFLYLLHCHSLLPHHLNPCQCRQKLAVSLTLGHVFSDLRIIGPNYVTGEKNDQYVKSVQRTVIWMGKKQEIVEDVPYGNTVAMVDSDQFITKDATLIN
ncbi:hypothetical protein PVL29_013637 [Vitis rotundifolia]|uniref:Uncharacterized protein n=1 Tax=Vitis rotundifolia TaxID=103349 RepID=A0AA38ZMG3_VITRO|nr:hypothetical protein PVL29_013637 [Vitis rotundifolia]